MLCQRCNLHAISTRVRRAHSLHARVGGGCSFAHLCHHCFAAKSDMEVADAPAPECRARAGLHVHVPSGVTLVAVPHPRSAPGHPCSVASLQLKRPGTVLKALRRQNMPQLLSQDWKLVRKSAAHNLPLQVGTSVSPVRIAGTDFWKSVAQMLGSSKGEAREEAKGVSLWQQDPFPCLCMHTANWPIAQWWFCKAIQRVILVHLLLSPFCQLCAPGR